jgi:hypothetical protein
VFVQQQDERPFGRGAGGFRLRSPPLKECSGLPWEASFVHPGEKLLCGGLPEQYLMAKRSEVLQERPGQIDGSLGFRRQGRIFEAAD